MLGITRVSEIKKFLGNDWKDEYKESKSALKKLYKLEPEKIEILSKAYDIGSTDKKDVMIYILENNGSLGILKIIAHINLIVEHYGVYSNIIAQIYNLNNDSKDVAIFVLKNLDIREQTTLLNALMTDEDYKQYGFDIDMINLHKISRKPLYWINLYDCSLRLIPSSFKEEILERENHTCSICGKTIDKSNSVLMLINTIVPKSSTYYDPDNHVEKDNITAVCKDCAKLIKTGCENGSIINLTDRFVLHNYNVVSDESSENIAGSTNIHDLPTTSEKCPQCNSVIGDDDVFCAECGCSLHDYPEIVYGRLLTKINYFKNLFDSIDFNSSEFDKEKMPLCYNKKSNIDYPMSNVLLADLLDWLCYLSQNDGVISDEEVNFINYILGFNLTREDVFSVFINAGDEYANVLPESFIYLYEYDLANNLTDSDKKTVSILNHLYMRIGEAFVNCEQRFKSMDEVTQDFERYGGYLNNLTENIENFEKTGYENLAKRTSDGTSSNIDLTSNDNNLEDNNISEDDKTLEEYIEELNKLIGLETVKGDVNSLINLIQVRQVREQRGMKQPPMSLHLVFSGNPGTGKTTVARLLAKIYHKMGLLSQGHLIETDRSGLVGGYVGQTAIKTQEVIQKAMGGILFIDEAYTLSSSKGEQDYGQESIDTILKAMEDNREDLIVIVAGYPNLMQEFLQSNPGLQSRFNKFIYFEDYNADELYKIFKSMCDENNLILEDKADEFVKTHFVEVYNNRGENFANGRDVRNLFETVLSNQANRIASNLNISDEELSTLKYEDFK